MSYPRWFKVYVLTLAVAALLVVPQAAVAALEKPVAVVMWTALLSMAGLAGIVSVPREQLEANLRTPVCVASALVLAPPLALLVNLLALASGRELRDHPSPWMIAFNHLQFGLVSYLASLVGHALPPNPVARTFVVVVLFHLANIVAIGLAAWLLGRASLGDGLRYAAMPFPRFAISSVFIALLAVLLVVLYQQVEEWAIGLLFVPLWLGHSAMRSAKAASDRAAELAARMHDLEVVHDLSRELLSAREPAAIAALGRQAVVELCEGIDVGNVVVALDGRVPPHLESRAVPGTEVRVGLPPDLDERRAARVGAVCSTLGLALQRLAMEEKLRASQRAEAALAEGILAEGTTARSVVALNVHDDVLPFLAAAQIQAENVLTAVERADTGTVTRLAMIVRDTVSDGIAALRDVLEDLRRQTIVPGDLLPRIRRAAEQAQVESGVAFVLDTERFDGHVSHPVEILLTETALGLIANIVRHAQASNMTVRLRSRGRLVILDVVDDGIGFDPERVGPGHQGLALMRQRAALAHGHFHVVARPGRGTTVRLRVHAGMDVSPSALRRPGTAGASRERSGRPLGLGQPELAEARQGDAPGAEWETAVR